LDFASWPVLGGLHRRSTITDSEAFFGLYGLLPSPTGGLNSYEPIAFAATEKSSARLLIAGTIFAALHWPNPVLVPLTDRRNRDVLDVRA